MKEKGFCGIGLLGQIVGQVSEKNRVWGQIFTIDKK
jgi:hypothetical protein